MKTAENVLVDLILPFIDQYKFKKFEKFFFIRYFDQFGSHIRIRFFNNDERNNLKLIELFSLYLKRYINNGIINKLLIDNYSRELERYSPKLIDITETFFFNDSSLVLSFLSDLAADNIDTDRKKMFFAMKRVIVLFNEFNLDSSIQYDIIVNGYNGYFEEFGGQEDLKRELNRKYRSIHKDLNTMDFCNSTGYFNYFTIIEQYKWNNIPVIQQIVSGVEDINHLKFLIPSYIHMFINRLYSTQQRKHELIVYHFLERYLNSQMRKRG